MPRTCRRLVFVLVAATAAGCVDQQKEAANYRKVLEGPALAHLVTLEPDGRPQVSIVWVGLDGDELVEAHLQGEGYSTICGANPLRGIPTDAPYIGSLLDSIAGPVVLVGHSMGGTVITNAAAGKSNVKALVYIAAFVPDVGETQGDLINKYPGSEVLPVSVPVSYTKADGTTGTDLYLSADGQAAFCADISKSAFQLLHATQRPFDAASFTYPTTAAAWHTIPVWGLVAGRDKAIPPAAERWMYSRANARKVVEVATSSHCAMLSHPRIVADLIEDAARAVCRP